MLYVIQVLSAILIGTAVGVLLGPRHMARFGGSVIAVALAAMAIFTGNWVFLAVGTGIFLLGLAVPAPFDARA